MSDQMNMDAERAAFEAWANDSAIHTDLGAWDAWKAARRTAPSAPMGEELPAPSAPKGPFADYSAEEVEAYARDYVAPYAERIRQLERELAERKTESIDTPEFRALLRAHAKASEERFSRGDQKAVQAERAARDSLIAYIDGRTAGAAPADPFAGQRFLNWNRSQDKPPVAIGKELGVARKVLEFAAAPTPMNSGKEEA